MNQQKHERAKRKLQIMSVCLSQRWTDWTQALREKFKLSWLRQPSLALTLLQPRGPLCLHYHRWHGGNWSLSPNIQLAISPLLEKSFWQGMAYGGALIDRKRAARPDSAKNETERREWTRAVFASELLLSKTALQDSVNFQNTGGLDWDAAAPLALVIARSEQEQHDADRTALGNTTQLVRQATLAQRVVRHYVRIEELAHRTLVSARPPATNVTTSVEHREALLEAAPVPRTGVMGRVGMETSDFDIERLTDRVVRRIDGRLIAHKERLGRVF